MGDTERVGEVSFSVEVAATATSTLNAKYLAEAMALRAWTGDPTNCEAESNDLLPAGTRML